MRQHVWLDPRRNTSAQLTTLCYDYMDGFVVPDHFHDADQLVFASKGVMTVRTKQGIWIVPSQRAVWIPAMTIHSIVMSGSVSMRTLYFAPKFVCRLPRSCCVINVSRLLREMILHACQAPAWSMKVSIHKRLLAMMKDLLQAAPSTPLQLPRPSDPRALRAAEVFLESPADGRSLADICRECGASKRTLERLFLEETQLT